jgi:hypothetical protein
MASTEEGDLVECSKIKVKEEFLSYQGTGLLSGSRQYFVRLAGCRVKCPLRVNCDQPEALIGTGVEPTDIRGIVDRAIKSVGMGGWMHITGGEPLEHPQMLSLSALAKEAGLRIQVQTSGSLPVSDDCGLFLSVSPKQQCILVNPSEIVLIACEWMTFEFAINAIADNDCPVFVVPEATEGCFSSGKAVELLESLHGFGVDARLGIQSHLVWGVK